MAADCLSSSFEVLDYMGAKHRSYFSYRDFKRRCHRARLICPHPSIVLTPEVDPLAVRPSITAISMGANKQARSRLPLVEQGVNSVEGVRIWSQDLLDPLASLFEVPVRTP